ncbi:hypothetical protein CR970_01485 [Candidatus Saccharibacteria bacterium]|nr:MAG: hypothetical protein CR970_01485 [Candidatus Saccharibacteria bacterium]
MKISSLRLASVAQPVALGIMGVIAVCVLYIFKLGSLVLGVDDQELRMMELIRSNGITLTNVLRDSTDLPYNLGMFIIQYLPFDHAGSVRILSVCIALAAVGSMFLVLRHWHTERIAVLGSALLAGSGWLLHLGRHGSPEILLVLPLVLLGAYAVWSQHKRSVLAYALIGATLACMLYTPGLTILVVLLLAWQAKSILKGLHQLPTGHTIVLLAAAALSLVPLAISLVWHADDMAIGSYLTTLLGVPSELPSIMQYVKNLGSIGMHIALVGERGLWPHSASYALLDVFTTTMAIIGMFVYGQDRKLDRSKALLVGFVVSWLIAGLGAISSAILLPFLYLFAAEGMRYMLGQWLSVFPRNPLAKTVGLSALSVAVCIAITFHILGYFTVWPHQSQTKAQFTNSITD